MEFKYILSIKSYFYVYFSDIILTHPNLLPCGFMQDKEGHLVSSFCQSWSILDEGEAIYMFLHGV